MNVAEPITVRAGVEDALRRAVARLQARSDSPRLDAELLLAHVLGVTRAGLMAHAPRPLTARQQSAFEDLVMRRQAGTPVAYLTETREFWSLALHVSPAVLVPRPETELLVEQLLQLVAREPPRSVLELGTGSGAIALAIAAERPGWQITATDVSADALAIAGRNARTLQLTSIQFRQGSWFGAVPGERFDLIVSNPPYVALGDPALAQLTAEPLLALSPGPSGLEALESIVVGAAEHLRTSGWLLLEHGHDQGTAVAQLLRHRGFESIRTCPDLSGKSRVTLGTLHSTVGKS